MGGDEPKNRCEKDSMINDVEAHMRGLYTCYAVLLSILDKQLLGSDLMIFQSAQEWLLIKSSSIVR